MRLAEARLVQLIDEQMSEAWRRAGSELTCRRGCTGCCIGPFPIQPLDASRLRRGLAELPPAAQRRIRQRALEAVAAMRKAGYPGDGESGLLDAGRSGELFSRSEIAWIPCPALDLETGSCQLYVWRPMACRTYGPAIRLEGQSLPHCRLNYRDASKQQVEQWRVTVDPGAAAQEALEEFRQVEGAAAADQGETVIAFALSVTAAPERKPLQGEPL